MAAYFVYIGVFLLALTQINGQQAVNGRVKITTVTTAGCRDTMNFIETQLAPTYAKYGQYLDVEFIPWGRTVWNEDGMTCQFQEIDCWANRLHRCALNLLKGNQEAQMHYMTCEFTSPYPSFELGNYLCAQAVGLSLVDIDHCVSNPFDDLDREAQQAAAEPMATINFVPAIVFNDVSDFDTHHQARSRLESMVCFALAADPSTGVTGCQI